MGEKALQSHLRSKLWSMLLDAEFDSGSPSQVIRRLRSLEKQIKSKCGDSRPEMIIPADLLYELIELVSLCGLFSSERRTAAVSKNSFFSKQLLLRHPLSDFMFNRRMKRRMDSLEKKIRNCIPIPPSELPSPPRPVMELAESEDPWLPWLVIGFEAEAKKIEALLMPSVEEEDAAALKLRTVGIVGGIACGKTALARKVFAGARIVEEFSPRIWVSLPHTLRGDEYRDDYRVRVGNYILKEIEQDDHVPDSDSMSLAEKLQRGLMGKRYLIVLDGAWFFDDWYDGFLPGGRGGAVIVTSRSENVIRRMVGDDDERVNVMWLEPHFSDEICWQIFSQMVQQQGKLEITHPKLCSIRDDLTRYFNGLPVVAKILANILPDILLLKSYWIPERDLMITWGDTRPPPQEVMELAKSVDVCWLNVKGSVDLKELSIKARYSAYLVFKLTGERGGPATAGIRIVCDGEDPEGEEESRVFIEPGQSGRFPQAREREGEGEEGWMEMKLGDFFTTLGDDGRSVEVSFFQVQDPGSNSGLDVKGIELRR